MMELKLSDLSHPQRMWVDQLVDTAARSGMEFDQAMQLGAHYAQILHDEGVDPEAKDWITVEQALDDYLQHGLQTAPSGDSSQPELPKRQPFNPTSGWNYLAHSGSLLMAAPPIVLLQEALQGSLKWYVPINWKFLLGILFAATLVLGYIICSWLYHRFGLARAGLGIAATAGLGASLVALPVRWWGREVIEAAHGYMPTALVAAVALAASWALRRFALFQHQRFVSARAAAVLAAQRSGDVSTSNDHWFEQLSHYLRQDHHYSLRLVKREIAELHTHLATLTEQRNHAIPAEEEFGSADAFALQLITSNRSAQLRKTWIDLAGAAFVVTLGVIVIVGNISELFTQHGWFLRSIVILFFLAWVLITSIWATTLVADIRRLTRERG